MRGTDFLSIKKTLMQRESNFTSPPPASKRNGRYNMVFKMQTPHMADSAIQDLIKRYPPKPHSDDQHENDEEALEQQAMLKMQLEKMLKIIDGLDH